MSLTVTAIRLIGAEALTKTLELPIEPVVGHWVEVDPDNRRHAPIESVWVRPIPSPWAPGLKTPSVIVRLGVEPDVFGAVEVARLAGWVAVV